MYLELLSFADDGDVGIHFRRQESMAISLDEDLEQEGTYSLRLRIIGPASEDIYLFDIYWCWFVDEAQLVEISAEYGSARCRSSSGRCVETVEKLKDPEAGQEIYIWPRVLG